MATITVSPTTTPPNTVIDVVGVGFDPKLKFVLTTVNSKGIESGYDTTGRPTNINRPSRLGAFSVGINSPAELGKSYVRAYQNGVVLAIASFTVVSALPPPPKPYGRQASFPLALPA